MALSGYKINTQIIVSDKKSVYTIEMGKIKWVQNSFVLYKKRNPGKELGRV